MINKPIISIIIPSYNRADTVGQTIDSIIAQKVNADIEIVIGDDCSTDNAREVLEQYRQKYPDIIRLFLREKNMGLGANWAQCVKDCRGKYICNCDNDDYWHNPNKLQLQLDYMESHPECNICITNHRTHNRKTGEIKEKVAFIDRSITLQQAFFKGRYSFCNATIMYRAVFIKKYLPLDDFIQYHFYLQDWPAWVILSAYSDIIILPYSTATFGIETVSITRIDTYDKLKNRMDKELGLYKYCCEMFPALNFDERGWYTYTNHLLLNMAYRRGEYKYAKKHVKNIRERSLKVFCAHSFITFYTYVFARTIKNKLKGLK